MRTVPEDRGEGPTRATVELRTGAAPPPVGARSDPTPGETPPAGGDRRPPRLARGVELLGRYEGSGLKEAPYLVRRGDGQMVQLPGLLYVVAQQVDGRRGVAEIAEAATDALERRLAPEDVRYLLDEKLAPLGILGGEDEEAAVAPRRADPMLALRFRTRVVPKRVVNAVTTVFRPLFLPFVAVAVLAGFVALDVWLFAAHGVAQGLRETLYQPALLLFLFAMVVVSGAFHEIGHATACRYGGATPGVMGVGIYVVWPAFYTDVTDSYRLGKWGRIRTDIGGVYFNAVFALALAAVYLWSGYEPWLLVVVVVQVEILHQLLPFLRMDGYYIVADVTGVPDLFSRIRPILASLMPWRRPDPRVAQLKGWVRAVATVWVLAVVPILAVNLAVLAVSAPRIFATAWDSFLRHAGSATAAFGEGRIAAAGVSAIHLVALVLPAAGLAYTFAMLARRTATGAWRWSRGSLARRSLALVAGAALVSALAYAWWPDEDYRPIGRDERWRVQDVARAIGALPGGDAALVLAGDGTGGEAEGSEGMEAGEGGDATDAGPAPAGASPSPSPSGATSGASPSPSAPEASPSPSSDAPSATPSPSPAAEASPSPTPAETVTPAPAPTASASP